MMKRAIRVYIVDTIWRRVEYIWEHCWVGVARPTRPSAKSYKENAIASLLISKAIENQKSDCAMKYLLYFKIYMRFFFVVDINMLTNGS